MQWLASQVAVGPPRKNYIQNMGRLVYNFASAIATAALVASVFFGCSQTVVPSEEDIQLAEEQQRILEHSSSSKKKNSAQSSSSQKTAAVSSSSAERLSSAEQSSSSKAKSSNSAQSSSSKQSNSSAAVASSSNSLESILEAVTESGAYTTRDSVAAYLCKFDKLPHNYIGKNEGQKLYEAQGNTFSKWNFNPWTTLGVMIGGDTFDNFADDPNPDYYHPTLPEGNYHEADVDYSGKDRGTKRLVYQPDCVIYYTADHYKNFERLKF